VLRTIVAAGVAASVVASGSLAQAATTTAPPTLAAVTQVAGKSLPVALAQGHWKRAGTKGWELPLRSASLPGGTTTVQALWSTSTFARRGQLVFRSTMVLKHEGARASAYSNVQEIRVCPARARCSAWFAVPMSRVPETIELSPLPVMVEVGSVTGTVWMGAPTTIQTQWRYRQSQRGPDVATADIAVSGG
jgi:hypothetical protein